MIPVRLWIGLMIFFTSFIAHIQRNIMPPSLLYILKQPDVKHSSICAKMLKFQKSAENRTLKIVPTYAWSEMEQGHVLSSYFYGFFLGCISPRQLVVLMGPKMVISYSIALSSFLTALSPSASHFGVEILCGVRALIGFLGGYIYPAINVLIDYWAPLREKGHFTTALLGSSVGTIFIFQFVAVISRYLGWHWSFYISSIVGAVFVAAFLLVVSDKPETHWFIKPREILDIQFSRGVDPVNVTEKPTMIFPYGGILKSVPFWAYCLAHVGYSMNVALIISYTPKFFVETLGSDEFWGCIISSAPPFASMVSTFIFGVLGGQCQKRYSHLSAFQIRRIFTVFSHLLAALMLLLILACRCHLASIGVLLVLNFSMSGAGVVAHLYNPRDFAPNFASRILEYMNFVTALCGLGIPLITGAFMEAYGNPYKFELWGPWLIFCVTASALTLSGLVFIACGTAEIQPWNIAISRQRSTRGSFDSIDMD